MTSNPVSESPNPADESSSPSNESSSGQLSDEQILPPVEPPNAGFILQLFIVPGLIVTVVFLLVLLIGWMRSAKEDPLAKVRALRTGNQARWQQAFELAQMLNRKEKEDDETPGLRENPELAKEIALLLSEQLEAAHEDDNSISLRYYLCRILGEFKIDHGLEVLLQVARKDAERDVRREAINALAVMGNSFNDKEPPQTLSHPELVDTFVELANDTDDLIRSQAAYAIGVYVLQKDSDERLTQTLERLIDDPYADARYNAALGLARTGNLQALDTVAEMLNLNAIANSLEKEATAGLQAFKRYTILKNAIDAASLLLEKNPGVELPEVTDALKRFVETASQEKEPDPVLEKLTKKANEVLKAAS